MKSSIAPIVIMIFTLTFVVMPIDFHHPLTGEGGRGEVADPTIGSHFFKNPKIQSDFASKSIRIRY